MQKFKVTPFQKAEYSSKNQANSTRQNVPIFKGISDSRSCWRSGDKDVCLDWEGSPETMAFNMSLENKGQGERRHSGGETTWAKEQHWRYPRGRVMALTGDKGDEEIRWGKLEARMGGSGMQFFLCSWSNVLIDTGLEYFLEYLHPGRYRGGIFKTAFTLPASERPLGATQS